MPISYTWRFKVRSYETGILGHVDKAIFLNYLEETATQASAAVGFDWDWYMAQRRIWILHRMRLRYHQSAVYGDEIEAKTWVSHMGRARSQREYELRRVSDQSLILRAQAVWVLVDMDNLSPQRIDEHFLAAFQAPNLAPSPLQIRLRRAEQTTDPHFFITYREVQSHEIDVAEIVNNSNYVRWAEHAYYRACHSIKTPFKRQMRDYNLITSTIAHEVEYHQPAEPGDRIRIASYVKEFSPLRLGWVHEIETADSKTLLARVYSVMVGLDMNSYKPQALPEVFLKRLIYGRGFLT